MAIAAFNGGMHVPVRFRAGTEIGHQSFVGSPRLGSRFSTYRFHVGHEIEHSGQSWDLYSDGNGLLVSIATTKANYVDVNGVLRSTCSTGIFTLVRTAVVTVLTSPDSTCKS